jgi:hypothetical protein
MDSGSGRASLRNVLAPRCPVKDAHYGISDGEFHEGMSCHCGMYKANVPAGPPQTLQQGGEVVGGWVGG